VLAQNLSITVSCSFILENNHNIARSFYEKNTETILQISDYNLEAEMGRCKNVSRDEEFSKLYNHEAIVTRSLFEKLIIKQKRKNDTSSEQFQTIMLNHDTSLKQFQTLMLNHATSCEQFPTLMLNHATSLEQFQTLILNHVTSPEQFQTLMLNHATSSEQFQSLMLNHATSGNSSKL
jgi:hypothetical protein